uniref:Uncharacterized protein n=1 Tax=Setaria italica TaxID=4555 RepID=K3XPW8_SETIT
MEYGYPYNGCGSNKEKRPPLKRGQLKLQIARTLFGSLVAPGAKNRERFFGVKLSGSVSRITHQPPPTLRPPPPVSGPLGTGLHRSPGIPTAALSSAVGLA